MSIISENKKIQTKTEFLSELEYYLYKYIDTKAVKETLNDYNGFFDEGLLEWKSEQALIHEFGCPQDIAEKLYMFRNSDNTYSQLPEKSLIITGRVFLIIVTIVLMLFLRVVPNLTYILNAFLLSDTEQMWQKSIIMCVIVIAVPLIVFGVLQMRKVINTKMQQKGDESLWRLENNILKS